MSSSACGAAFPSPTPPASAVDGQGSMGVTPCVFVSHDHLRGTDGRAWRRATVAADQPFITIQN